MEERDDVVTEAAVKERPILFSERMVRALLTGRKTQTRRILKLRDPSETYSVVDDSGGSLWPASADEYGQWHRDLCPYGCPGDRLWVRETWSPDHARTYPHYPIVYRAEGYPTPADVRESKGQTQTHEQLGNFRWRPSIFMRREHCRITLELTAVRVERLQAISEADAVAEGFNEQSFRDGRGVESARHGFRTLWGKINGKRPGCTWEDNPWVWVVSFNVVK